LAIDNAYISVIKIIGFVNDEIFSLILHFKLFLVGL